MFMLMKVPRGSCSDELGVVCAELDARPSPVYVPRLFIKLGLETLRLFEKNTGLDCGPTVGIDTALSARSRVAGDGRAIAGWKDMRSALYSAISTNTRPKQNFSQEAIDALIPDVAGFLQRELSGIDLALLIGNFHTGIGAADKISPVNLKRLICGSQPELEKLTAWVVQHEKIYNFRIYEVLVEYLQAYQEGIAQLKKARGSMQKSIG
jgi:hypothetical protein